jgi:hypothetical protein
MYIKNLTTLSLFLWLSINVQGVMTWKSYNAKCLPCDVKYDVIMKLETHTEDEKWLINTRYSRCPPESCNLECRS